MFVHRFATFLNNYSFDRVRWYNWILCPLAITRILSSSMVHRLMAPLSYIVSISDGPRHLAQNFPSKSLNLESINNDESLAMNLFFFINLSFHLFVSCFITLDRSMTSYHNLCNSLIWSNICLQAFDRSNPSCIVILNVWIFFLWVEVHIFIYQIIRCASCSSHSCIYVGP